MKDCRNVALLPSANPCYIVAGNLDDTLCCTQSFVAPAPVKILKARNL